MIRVGGQAALAPAAGCTDGVLAVKKGAHHPVAVMLAFPQTKLLGKASVAAPFDDRCHLGDGRRRCIGRNPIDFIGCATVPAVVRTNFHCQLALQKTSNCELFS